MIRLVRAVVPVLLLAFVAGCGGSGDADNGVAELAPDAALAKVTAAAKAVDSVHLVGTVDESGMRLGLDVHAEAGRGEGVLTVGGGRLELRLASGATYVRGSAETYRALGAPATQAQLIADRWLKAAGGSGQFAAFAQFLDVRSLFGSLFAPEGTVRIGGRATVRGEPAVILLDDEATGEGVGGRLYVATTGRPLPLRLSKAGTGGGQVDFTDYDAGVDVAVPDGAVDIGELGR